MGLRSFRHRGLASLWNHGITFGVRVDLVDRVKLRLLLLYAAGAPRDAALPGFHVARIEGEPARYTLHVLGPFFLTYGWADDDAIGVDLEQSAA